MPIKEVKVFVYGFNLPQTYHNKGILMKQFNKSNILNNIASYGDDSLLLIIDKEDNDSLFGRFLILRKDIPSILNKQTQEERELTLSKDENIKEESHFLINLKEKLLLGEYNHYSIRHFPHPIMYYFKNMLIGQPIDIRPYPNPNTLNLLKKDSRKIKSFEFSVGQESLTSKEQRGIPLIGALRGLSSNNESCIKIIITSGRKRANELDSENIIERLENLKHSKSDDLNSLKVETEKSKYDLLNGNLIHFIIPINQINNRTSKTDFYDKIKSLYNQEISNIKSLIR